MAEDVHQLKSINSAWHIQRFLWLSCESSRV